MANLSKVHEVSRDNPIDGLMEAVGNAAENQQDIMEIVGDWANQKLADSSRNLEVAVSEAISELGEMKVAGPDAESVKTAIKDAFIKVLQRKYELPVKLMEKMERFYTRTDQALDRAFDVRAGASMLPLVKRACEGITEQDVQDAKECGDMMDAFEALLGMKKDSEEMTPSRAGKLLAKLRHQK